MASRINNLQTYSLFLTISPPSILDEGRHLATKYSYIYYIVSNVDVQWLEVTF